MEMYGNLMNRLAENKMFCEEIVVGMGMTEYSWSDREAYEVIEVKDQKHVVVRRYDHRLIGEAMSNQWELISNEDNPCIEMAKRGKYWYAVVRASVEHLEAMERMNDNDKMSMQLWLAQNDFNADVIRKKGSQVRYHRMNVSFGVADYYYDYSF
jgi:hypothetical protein